jgi:hypothetical protein
MLDEARHQSAAAVYASNTVTHDVLETCCTVM